MKAVDIAREDIKLITQDQRDMATEVFEYEELTHKNDTSTCVFFFFAKRNFLQLSPQHCKMWLKECQGVGYSEVQHHGATQPDEAVGDALNNKMIHFYQTATTRGFCPVRFEWSPGAEM